MTKQRTPFEVDTELAELYREYDKADRDRTARTLYLGLMVFGRNSEASVAEIIEASELRIAAGKDDNLSYGRAAIARTLAAVIQLGSTKVEIGVKIAECDREYDAQGGWSRFFLATSHNGHVHSSMNCSTCNRGGQVTSFAWLPELSGKSEAEAVAEWGEKMCTVCFPSAPANPDFNRPSRRDREAAQAKAEEKAVKDAEKAAKVITDTDGSPLKVKIGGYTETITTLASAKQRLRDVMFNLGFYGRQNPEKDRTQEHTAIAKLLAAIAAKTGEDADALRADFQKKADAKVRKALGR